MKNKQLWMLVGGNGAGKSTFYSKMLAPLGMPFVNADIIAKEIYPESPEIRSYEAALIAEELRNNLLAEGRTFCFETVFSHPSKIDFIAWAKGLGYEIIMIVIHLDHAGLNKARISQRVSMGGHHVADDKVEHRIPRVLENVKTAIPLCDEVRLLDNSSYENPFTPMAMIKRSTLKKQLEPLPEWAVYLLDCQFVL